MFVAIEGPDGTGKTTHVERLLKHYNASLVPGCSASPIGRTIRQALSGAFATTPDELQALYTADRVARNRDLRVRLDIGEPMIADRWTLSALVYGSLHVDDNDVLRAQFRWLLEINERIVRPDLYVVLCAPTSTLLERLQKRRMREIYEHKDVVEKLGNRYALAARALYVSTKTPFVCVDTRDDSETVQARIVEEIERYCDA